MILFLILNFIFNLEEEYNKVFKVNASVKLDCSNSNGNVSFYFIDIKSKDGKEIPVQNDNHHYIEENKLIIRNLSKLIFLNVQMSIF